MSSEETVSAAPRPVVQSEGTTQTERLLARLCKRSFLSLWTYPNPYKDDAPGEAGRELVDVLVVCGNAVILFSDKLIRFGGEKPVPLAGLGSPLNKREPDIQKQLTIAWSRWYRRAVQKSAEQLHSAANWIERSPIRVFVDPECKQRLPLELPDGKSAIFFRVVVASGIAAHCRDYYDDDSGTLPLAIRVASHATASRGPPVPGPFTIGDVDPTRPFVHVFDDHSIELLLRERDTITDFIEYLAAREEFLRSGISVSATGEEDLLGFYFSPGKDRHGFDVSAATKGKRVDYLSLGGFRDFLESPAFERRREHDKISYAWDDLISTFTGHMLAGTLRAQAADDLQRVEPGVRLMALEPRLSRRGLSIAFLGALNEFPPNCTYFCRLMPRMNASDTPYVILQVRRPPSADYQRYRALRQRVLSAYCLRQAKEDGEEGTWHRKIVGIATAAGRDFEEDGSMDIAVVDLEGWSDEDERALQMEFELLGIGPAKRQYFKIETNEFPQAATTQKPPKKSKPKRRIKKRRAQRDARRANR